MVCRFRGSWKRSAGGTCQWAACMRRWSGWKARGWFESSLGDPTPERGGKAKRFFRVTKEGLRQVHETRRVLTRLWRSLPELKGESS
jgi:hypothetical protein